MNRHDTNLEWNTKVDNQNFLCTKSTRDGAPPLPGKPKLSNGSRVRVAFVYDWAKPQLSSNVPLIIGNTSNQDNSCALLTRGLFFSWAVLGAWGNYVCEVPLDWSKNLWSATVPDPDLDPDPHPHLGPNLQFRCDKRGACALPLDLTLDFRVFPWNWFSGLDM